MMIITVVFLIFGFGLALFTKPFVVLTGVATITAIITIIFIIANKSDWLMEYIFSPIGRTVWRFGLGQIMRSIGTILKWVFVCVMDICLAILPKKPESTKTNTLNKPRQPGFLMQKYLAIKENYCPMIEYTEQ